MKRAHYTLVAVFAILLIAPYLRYTAYQTQSFRPFAGNTWYNPYAHPDSMLLRANFHAHSRSWWGITWGENSAPELIDAYAAKDYQVPSLSNYHKMADHSLYDTSLVYVPVYEHGLNWRKVHCLCIGASDISFVDYPLHFMKDHTIHVLHTLRKHCALTALAHPGARNAHVPADMPSFGAMQLMEVGNTQGVLTSYWDAALSAGQLIWILANDDTHDLEDGEAFMRWNMIYTHEATAEGVIDALRRGNHYSVASYDGLCEENRLTRVTLHEDTLRISVRDTFNRLDFIGQGGVHLHNVSKDTAGWYVLQQDDAYVRTEIHHDHCVMYLNPLVRYDGIDEPYTRSSVPVLDRTRTWLGRGVVLLGISLISLIWLKLMRRSGPDA